MRAVPVLAILLGSAAALTGCEQDTNHAELLCRTLCDCQPPLPTGSDCVAACIDDVPEVVAPACVDCILTSSCVELATDGCDDVCDSVANALVRGGATPLQPQDMP